MNKKVDLKDIIQIGVITDSTEESNKVLETVLGWKHWGIWETTPGTGRYYYDAEEDFSCRMSFYSFGKIELEVIEPLRGRSCWRNYLSKTGGGIHHFLFNVHSASEAKKMFDSYGWTTEQQGMARPYGEKVIWAYADTEHDLDFTVEYTNRKEYPQVNPTVHPTVEGMFKTLIGVRILTEDMERVSKNYEEILGWNVEQGTDHTAYLTFKLPKGMSTVEGAMLEPFSVGLSAINHSSLAPSKRAVILGAGCIGQMTLLALKAAGVDHILITDLCDNRLNKAMELGAEFVVNSGKEDIEKTIDDYWGGKKADIVYETAGSHITAQLGSKLLAKKGELIIVGNIHHPVTLDILAMSKLEASLKTV